MVDSLFKKRARFCSTFKEKASLGNCLTFPRNFTAQLNLFSMFFIFKMWTVLSRLTNHMENCFSQTGRMHYSNCFLCNQRTMNKNCTLKKFFAIWFKYCFVSYHLLPIHSFVRVLEERCHHNQSELAKNFCSYYWLKVFLLSSLRFCLTSLLYQNKLHMTANNTGSPGPILFSPLFYF